MGNLDRFPSLGPEAETAGYLAPRPPFSWTSTQSDVINCFNSGRALRGMRSGGNRSRLTANATSAAVLIGRSTLLAQLSQLSLRPQRRPNSYWLWTMPIERIVSYIDWRNSLFVMHIFSRLIENHQKNHFFELLMSKCINKHVAREQSHC